MDDIDMATPMEKRVFKKNDAVVVSWTSRGDGLVTMLIGHADPKGIIPRPIPIALYSAEDAQRVFDALGVKNFE